MSLGMFWREPGQVGQGHELIFLESPARQPSRPSADVQKRKVGDVGSSVYGSGWRQQLPRAEPASNIAMKAYGNPYAVAAPPAPATAPAAPVAPALRNKTTIAPVAADSIDNPDSSESPKESLDKELPVERGSSLHDTFMDVLDQELKTVGLPTELFQQISTAVDRSLKDLLDAQQKELEERLQAKLKKDLESEEKFWSHARAARKALLDEACRQAQESEVRFWSHAKAVREEQVKESEERSRSDASEAREAFVNQARLEASQALQHAAADGTLKTVLDQMAADQLPATYCYDNDLLDAMPSNDVADDMMGKVISCSVSWFESLLDDAQPMESEAMDSEAMDSSDPKSCEQERREHTDEAIKELGARYVQAADDKSPSPAEAAEAEEGVHERSPSSAAERPVLSGSSCTPSLGLSEVASSAVHDVVDLAASLLANDVMEDAAQSVALSQQSEELWEDMAFEVAKEAIASHLLLREAGRGWVDWGHFGQLMLYTLFASQAVYSFASNLEVQAASWNWHAAVQHRL